jgi:hypothetical protein
VEIVVSLFEALGHIKRVVDGVAGQLRRLTGGAL